MLYETSKADPDCAALADRHYSRQNVGATLFMPPGRTLVLRDDKGSVVFGWLYAIPEYRLDKLDGYCCTIFRNESEYLSSSLIAEAELAAIAKWGERMRFTYVDPREVKSPNPGYCFKVAGWLPQGWSTRGRLLLTHV